MIEIIKKKKFSLPIIMSAISLYISIAFFWGAIVGYLLTYFFFGKIKSKKISLGNYRIHLHHWVFSSVALIIIFLSGINNFLPVFLLGIGGGNIFHGIYSYNDWHKIIYREK